MTNQDDLNPDPKKVPSRKDPQDRTNSAAGPQSAQDEKPVDGQTLAEIGDKVGGPA